MVWTGNSNESSYESPNLLANIDSIKKDKKRVTSHKDRVWDIHPETGVEGNNHGLYDRGVSDHFHG